MKKIIFFLIVLASIASLQSCKQSCTFGKPTISIDSVRIYMGYYQQLVVHYGDSAAWQWVGLTKDVIECLSTDVDSVKFIAASTSSTDINQLTTIAELCKNSTCLFYSTDILFPALSGQNKPHIFKTCPPPSNCHVP